MVSNPAAFHPRSKEQLSSCFITSDIEPTCGTEREPDTISVPKLCQVDEAEACTHFVRFTSLSDQRFQNAVRAFGKPDFLHRHWDNRARREIAAGDLVVFAKGDADQPTVPFNGNDEAYP